MIKNLNLVGTFLTLGLVLISCGGTNVNVVNTLNCVEHTRQVSNATLSFSKERTKENCTNLSIALNNAIKDSCGMNANQTALKRLGDCNQLK